MRVGKDGMLPTIGEGAEGEKEFGNRAAGEVRALENPGKQTTNKQSFLKYRKIISLKHDILTLTSFGDSAYFDAGGT